MVRQLAHRLMQPFQLVIGLGVCARVRELFNERRSCCTCGCCGAGSRLVKADQMAMLMGLERLQPAVH